MFFRGLDSPPLRAAYLLTALSFVTTPINFYVTKRSLDHAFLFFSGGVVVFCLLAAILHKPRDEKIAITIYSLVAFLMHLGMTPVFDK